MGATIAVCSLGGAPGVTTVAVALASMWPHQVPAVVVEADPKGGNLAAWRHMPTKPGLIGLAAAARNNATPASANGSAPSPRAGVDPWQHSQALPGGLAVCPAPAPAHQSQNAVWLLAHHPHVLRPSGEAVSVVDLGRLTPRSPATHLAVAPAIDAVALLCSDEEAELKRVHDSLTGLGPIADRLGLVVVGERDPDREITEAVDLPLWGRIPLDHDGVALVHGQRHHARQRWPALRRLRGPHPRPPVEHQPLMRAARDLGQHLSSAHDQGRWQCHDSATSQSPQQRGTSPRRGHRFVLGAAARPVGR